MTIFSPIECEWTQDRSLCYQLRRWVCLLQASFPLKPVEALPWPWRWSQSRKVLNDYMEQSSQQPPTLTTQFCGRATYTSILFKLLVIYCSPLFQQPSPNLINIVLFRQTKISLLPSPIFLPLLILVENHCRLWIFLAIKKIESDFTLLDVLEQLANFTKNKMTFNFFPYHFHL